MFKKMFTKEEAQEHMTRLPKLLDLFDRAEETQRTIDGARASLDNALLKHGDNVIAIQNLGGKL